LRICKIIRCGRPRASLDRGEPTWKSAAICLCVDIWPRPRDHVKAGLRGGIERPVKIADTAEVIDARGRRVIAPVEIAAHGVETSGLHFFKYIPLQIRAW
jgi:hypothetical protein